MTHVLLGVVTRLAGGGSATGTLAGSVDGVGSAAYFRNPAGLALSTSGTIYVADSFNHLVRVISPTGSIIVSWKRKYIFICYLFFVRCGDEVGWWRKCYWCNDRIS